MAIYFTNKVMLDPISGLNTIPPKYLENGETLTQAVFTAPVGVTLAAGDTILICDVPQFCTYTSFVMDSDNFAITGLTLNVGDTIVPARFFAASNGAQAGGTITPTVAGSTGYRTVAVTRVLATVVGSASGAIATTPKSIRFGVYYDADV